MKQASIKRCVGQSWRLLVVGACMSVGLVFVFAGAGTASLAATRTHTGGVLNAAQIAAEDILTQPVHAKGSRGGQEHSQGRVGFHRLQGSTW